MATVANLVQRTRRLIGDWPDRDSLSASISSSGTTATVADSSIYVENHALELEDEALIIRDIPAGGVTLTVARGRYGSTAVSHANSTTVLINPRFRSVDILDALNAGQQACWPYIYQPVTNTTLTTTASTYEYNVPSVGTGQSQAIPYIYRVDIQESGETKYRERKDWEIISAATRVLRFKRTQPAGATLRLYGYASFADLTLSGSTATAFPVQAENPLCAYAAAYLLQSAEAQRVRVDTGTIDNREQANRVGASASAAAQLMARFYREIQQIGMPPMTRHVRGII